MQSLWRFFIERKQFSLILIAVLTIWGLSSALLIAKESSPEIQIPVGVISVALPGASASDVERLVTDKIEERVANISGMSKLTSTSRDGVSIITAEFNAQADLDKSIQKLKDEVDKVKPDLPTDATDPVVTDVNFADQPVQIISITADLPFAKFADLGESLKNELQGLKGVSRIEVSGVRNREVQVVVKKEQLSRYSLSLNEVIAAIGATNASLPVGSIIVDQIAYSLNFKGDLDDVADLGSIPLVTTTGQTIYLRDIATVSDGVVKATTYSRVSLAGKPSAQAMTLFVYKVRGQNVGQVTEAVKAKLKELKKTELQGSDVLITFDLGDQIQKDLTTLSETGLETIALVMLCLLITLGWREALVAGLSIPLSFFIAFIGLYYSGNTINFVSLFALILAIGILVDSGIVVVEAIHTRYRTYGNKKRAAFEALNDYAWPLIGGTVATVAFFVPLFFISGVVGKFIASIPFTIIFVLIASIFVALGLVPLLAMMFIRKGHTEESTLMKKQEAYTQLAQNWYSNFISRVLTNRRFQNWFMAGMTIAFFVSLALPVVGLVKVNFFPADNGDFIYVDIEKPQGTTLPLTDLTAREVEEKLYDNPEIESIVTTVGGTSAFSQSPETGEKFANITLNLKKKRVHTSTEMVNIVKKELADVTSGILRVTEPAGGPPVGAPILIKFVGTNRDALTGAVDLAQGVLKQVSGVIDIDASNKNDATEYTLSIDRAKLANVGLSPVSVAQTLRAAVSGVTATKLTGGTKDANVVVTLNLNPNFTDPHDAANTTIDAISQIPVKTNKGNLILLGSVLTATVDRSNTVITHEGRQRIVTVSANVSTGHNSRDAVSEFEMQMKNQKLPDGVTYSIGGENEETNKSFAEMGIAFFAGLALSYIVLVLSFNSFRYAAYLALMIFLSLIGVFGGLAISFQDLSFSSVLGVIALAGVIVNHAIILVDSIIQRIKLNNKEIPFDQLIREAATSRLRPIILTTITTVLGMIPLTMVSALWGPLAFAIMFGLTFAMLLTLILIPILIYRWPGNLDHFIDEE